MLTYCETERETCPYVNHAGVPPYPFHCLSVCPALSCSSPCSSPFLMSGTQSHLQKILKVAYQQKASYLNAPVIPHFLIMYTIAMRELETAQYRPAFHPTQLPEEIVHWRTRSESFVLL